MLHLPDADDVAALSADLTDTALIALGNTMVRDRFTGTAVLAREQALDLGALGYVARASGLDIDARRDHPFHPATLDLPSAVRADGDVLARLLVRRTEIGISTDLVRRLLAQARTAPQSLDVPAGAGVPRPGVGLVEGWRGTIAHRVEIGPDGRLTRWKIVDPSFLTWPALPMALTDTIVPDFPLVNKSFNLSYAGNDR